MRRFLPVVAVLALVACTQEPKSDLKTDKAKLSYAIGQEIGGNFKAQKLDIDTNALAMSINDVLAGKKSALSQEDIQKVQQNFQSSRMESAKAEGEKNKASGEAFLENNKKQEGFKTTADGLQYKVVTSGKGPTPKESDTVIAQYEGRLIDGTVFDSSYKRGQPAEFPVNGVIPGWTEALKMMHVGDKWMLAIPPKLAYGEQGRPPAIAPNSVLLFDIELVGIKGKTGGSKKQAKGEK